MATKKSPVPAYVNFATAGIGGIFAWIIVHPFNTLAIRMNLLSSSGALPATSFARFSIDVVKKEGIATLYKGLSAGLMRQVFYATSRLGLFDLFRDTLAQYRETDLLSRLIAGVVSGGECISSFVAPIVHIFWGFDYRPPQA
jgi:solute carrier family 25 (mitochondrial oxoglutarate transporter), member 11